MLHGYTGGFLVNSALYAALHKDEDDSSYIGMKWLTHDSEVKGR